jgi:hypothetical protein
VIGQPIRNAVGHPHIQDQVAASPSSKGRVRPVVRVLTGVSMSTAEYSRKLDELDRLLNDPDVPMQPDRIWSLLADVSRPEAPPAASAICEKQPA